MHPGISRRSFFRIAAAGSAAAAFPLLSEAHFAHAQRAMRFKAIPHDAVRINANENPLGPCGGACGTIQSLIPEGGRYDDDLTDKFVDVFTQQEGLKPGYVLPYAGSSEPLSYAVVAFTSKDRSYVTADPGYEAGMRTADAVGAKIIKVPLTADHKHDVKAMVAADPNAGVIYICNPNNPTGTVISHDEIQYALDHKPAGSILLIDEAYIHFSDTTSAIDMVKADKDVIILRTFSKIYGMAGMRCGVAIARPDLLQKLAPYGGNAMPVLSVASATASLQEPGLVPERKKINAEIRSGVFDWLAANNYSFIPSQSNCFMLDTRRPGKEVLHAMAEKNVYIGRVWPIWPTYVRVTVGTRQDMQRFQAAFHEVMNNSTAHLGDDPMPIHQRGHRFLS